MQLPSSCLSGATTCHNPRRRAAPAGKSYVLDGSGERHSPAAPTLIEDGVTGLLVPAERSDRLAEALDCLAADQELR